MLKVKRVKRAFFESLQASEAARVGPDGAGPTIVKPKWANSVRLVHRPTGSLITLVNQHAVASAQNRRIPEQERNRRRAVFTKQVSTCVEMITGLPGLVFVTADWNATPAPSPGQGMSMRPCSSIGKPPL
jgi:hypothetical protein